jgi:hypothetical protein
LILNVNNNYYAFGNCFLGRPQFYGCSPLGSKKKNIFSLKIFAPEWDGKNEDRSSKRGMFGRIGPTEGGR